MYGDDFEMRIYADDNGKQSMFGAHTVWRHCAGVLVGRHASLERDV